MNGEQTVLDRALDAAMELVLESPPPLPVMPSSSAICGELGIGVSTFYRLFASVEEYRDALVDRLLSSPYASVEPDLINELTDLVDVDPAELTLDDGALRIAVFYDKSIEHAPAPHADWMPWIGNDAVKQSLHRSAHASADIEGAAVAMAIGHFGRHLLEPEKERGLVLRQIAVTIASKLCGVADVRWPVGDGDVPLVAIVRWRLGMGLISDPPSGQPSR